MLHTLYSRKGRAGYGNETNLSFKKNIYMHILISIFRYVLSNLSLPLKDGYSTNLTDQGIITISLDKYLTYLSLIMLRFYFNRQSINEKEKIAF